MCTGEEVSVNTKQGFWIKKWMQKCVIKNYNINLNVTLRHIQLLSENEIEGARFSMVEDIYFSI